MANRSAADTVFTEAERAATAAIEGFPRMGLSVEIDKRGKHPSMVIRIIPAIKVKKHGDRKS